MKNTALGCLFVLCFICVIALFSTPTNPAVPVSSNRQVENIVLPSSTPAPDATTNPSLATITPIKVGTASSAAESARVKILMANLSNVPGLVWIDPSRIRAYPSEDKEFFSVYIESVVSHTASRNTIALEMFNRTVKTLKFEPSDFTLIMFDGAIAEKHLYEHKQWNVSQLNLGSEIMGWYVSTTTALAPRPTRTRPPRTEPTDPPVIENNPLPISACPVNPDPRNCEEALAMGLSAEQAALCTGTDGKGRSYPLDRNGNGVACYGD